MQSFLDQLVVELNARFPGNLDQLCIVFPSRRASVFFQDALEKRLEGPAWSPEIYAIEDFVRELSDLTLLDPVSLAFELYPIYQEAYPEEPFDKFYSWGALMVSDFDEIDRYLLDADAIFANLYELKKIDTSIEAWLNEGGKLSEGQQSYLSFWDHLAPFYQKLKKRLLTRKSASAGLAMRQCAEKVSQEKPNLKWQKVVFAGFNAITPAEELLMRSLIDWEQAICFWDMDRYYVEDAGQEAGKYFRDIQNRWKDLSFDWIGDQLSTKEMEIRVSGIPHQVGQAKLAGNQLAELIPKVAQEDKVAVVLPDENLLFPLLHSLPEVVKEVNITMGFPLRNTPLYSLVDSIISLHENSARLRPYVRSGDLYYYRDVRQIINHPYIKNIAFDDTLEMLKEISNNNLIYLSVNYFRKFPEDTLIGFLFQPWESIQQAISFFLDLFRKLKSSMDGPDGEKKKMPDLEAEFLYHFYTLTSRLEEKISRYTFSFDLKTFRRLYKEVIQTGSLPFSGEPLKGLQIMGMLETRVLDFDHLIILSTNEKILPNTPQAATFIPYNLRKAFGLPTYEDKDAIFAYHFYRLLQRAKTVQLIHNTESDTFGAGEKSRFVAQIKAELLERNPKIKYQEETLFFTLNREEIIPVTVPKSPEVFQTLRDYCQERGLSPSALSSYIACPLRFYFRYIVRLKEKEDVEESMEDNTFGQVAHAVLEELYEPFKGKTLTSSDLQKLQKQVDASVDKQFVSITRQENLSTGKNKLLLGVIRNMVRELLEADEKDTPFEIIGLEEEMEVKLKAGKDQDEIAIRGVLDRIDKRQGVVRIIDYKTGGTSERLEVKEFSDLLEKKNVRKAFQLSSYAFLYLRNFPDTPQVQSGIYYLRDLTEGLKLLQTGSQLSDSLDYESLYAFEGQIHNLLEEIFDPETPFAQTEDTDQCRICAYQTICARN